MNIKSPLPPFVKGGIPASKKFCVAQLRGHEKESRYFCLNINLWTKIPPFTKGGAGGIFSRYFFEFFFLFFISFAHASPTPFQLSTPLISQEGIQLHWKMMNGAYLYKKFINITSLTPNIILGTPLFPEGQTKDTQLFGKVTVYHDTLTLSIPIENPTHQSVIKLKVAYQGCSEQGQCFSPTSETVAIDLTAQSAKKINPMNKNETEKIEETLENQNNNSFVWILGGFFILGLLLSMTPCVLPMIPILSSIILYGYEHQISSKIKTFSLSFAYIVGMSLAYASLGFLMSLFGSRVQMFLQNSYILSAFVIIFSLLALSLLGFFEFRLSGLSDNMLSRFNQRLAKIGCKNHATVLGMGFISALVISPCITPPLVGALSYITTTGNYIVGTSALFTMGLGLGVPLLFIGALGNRFLPKAGPWMDNIKFLMGIILLGVAFFLLQRLLPQVVTLLWSIFLILTSILVLYKIELSSSWQRIFLQVVCFIGIVTGGLIIIQHTLGKPSSEGYVIATNTTQLTHYLNVAKKEHKPVIIDFYADWCPDCQLMETHVFNHPHIVPLLDKFMWIKIDMTKDSPEIWGLQEKYGVAGPPTFLFYAANGEGLEQFNFVGNKSTTSFSEILKQIDVMTEK